MILLGVHTTVHDTGACLFEDGKLVFSIETERLTRIKHDDDVEVAIAHLFAETGIGPEHVNCVAFSTHVRNSLARIKDWPTIARDVHAGTRLHVEAECELLGRPVPCVIVAHEASHAALACQVGGWRDRGLILVNEMRGTFSRNSCFVWAGGQLTLVARDRLPWYATGFGWSTTSHLLGFGSSPSAPGTIMALGAYAEADAGIRDLFLDAPSTLAYQTREEQVVQGAAVSDFIRQQTTFDGQARTVATLQDLFTSHVVDAASQWMKEQQSNWLGLGGGCALNLPTNTRLRALVAEDLAIAPNCNDAGQALGAAVYALKLCQGITPERFGAFVNGRPLAAGDTREQVQRHGLAAQPYDPQFVAGRLAAGDVVALCQGRSEIGPRALGNRSLLASAHVRGMRTRVSERIKRREWFRPLACVMRADRFSEHFAGAPRSPFMLFSYEMPDGLAPEAVHRDRTSRVQTIEDGDNPRLADLLERYEGLTGHQMLINTSLNARGCAIAYDAADVLADFADSDVDLFVFEDLMVRGPRARAARDVARAPAVEPAERLS